MLATAFLAPVGPAGQAAPRRSVAEALLQQTFSTDVFGKTHFRNFHGVGVCWCLDVVSPIAAQPFSCGNVSCAEMMQVIFFVKCWRGIL